ncbi:MAG TPA: condensation domain-containing protein [Rugosimonospora sp.]|nr:condensation domain-containing protein [Rugosimonospora sp.]
MHSSSTGPLSYGQLSVWRDVQTLPPHRWHEANDWNGWRVPEGVDSRRVRQAVAALSARHPSLRTRYDFSDPACPRQGVAAAADVEIIEGPIEGDPMVEQAQLVNRPFDLDTDFGWRIRIVTAGGRPTDIFMIKHHMVADGWCGDVLAHDFQAFLRDPAVDSAATGPLDLAAWQHDPRQERTRVAAAGYWEKLFAAGTGTGFPGADPSGSGALRCTIRSRPAYAGAARLAARTGTSVSSVVLAAYTLAVAEVAGVDALVAQTMCSNRFSPQWRQVVTSMNQWTAMPVAAVDDLAEHAALVHRAVLTAYRFGMYNVDTVAGLRTAAAQRRGTEHAATCAFNFLTEPQLTGPLSDDGALYWDEPFSTVGPECYLVAAEEAGTALMLRVRTKGIAQEQVTAFMTRLHALLVH